MVKKPSNIILIFFTGVSEDNVAKEIKDWLIRTDVELVGVLMYEENPPACTMTWQCYKVYYKHKELR